LLKTAFFYIAAGSNIDKREIALIKTLCEKSSLFENLNFQEEINQLVTKLNKSGKAFIQYYLDLLKQTSLSVHETLIPKLEKICFQNKIKYRNL